MTLTVNDMKEVEHGGRNKFVPSDVTVSVMCKPKHIYPSSATNWANDLVANRYLFLNEHEIPLEEAAKETVFNNAFVKNALPYFTAMRDSVFQFELMTIKEDYEKVTLGGDHLSREKLRVRIFLKRLDIVIFSIDQHKQHPVLGKSSRPLIVGRTVEKHR